MITHKTERLIKSTWFAKMQVGSSLFIVCHESGTEKTTSNVNEEDTISVR